MLTVNLEPFAAGRQEGDVPGLFQQPRRVHNGLIDKRPALIARCRTVPDIQDAVIIGCEQATEISVRGGGHNVAGRLSRTAA